MKQFLVLMAVLPLMLVFFVQFSLDQLNNARINAFSDYVYAAKEEAKQAGYFTEEILERLTGNISRAFDIEASAVLIQVSDTLKYRVVAEDSPAWEDFERGLIYYKISVPVAEIMAGRRLFGIKEEDNTFYYTIESYAASECLP